MFTRLHTGGSLLPDEDAESKVRSDRLPCLLELRHTIKQAHDFVAEHDDIYKDILALASVQNRARPSVSAFAIYCQDLMSGSLSVICSLVEATGLHVVAYVFDCVYVIADSHHLLEAAFNSVAEKANAEHGLKLALKAADGTKLPGA